MARFEPSRERRRDSKDSYSGSRRSSRDNPKGKRGFGRETNVYGSKNRRDAKMTQVTCSSCGVECEVPFKPTSTKPVYCNDCYSKEGKSKSGPANKDFDMINEKLNKIMKALKIE